MAKNSPRMLAIVALMLLAATGVSIADTYPSKPITFVVPWQAGGRTDIVGRLVADAMSEKVGQPIAVVNREGGRGAIGTKAVLDAPKDGYTVLVTTPGNHVLPPAQRDVGYVPSDFTAIGRVASDSVLLAANKDQPFSNAKELIEYAKSRPGEVTVSAVRNVLPHLTAAAFADKAGLSFKFVPAKGDAESVPMALGGHVNVVSSSSLNAVASHIEAGTLHPLIVFADSRLPELPDTPTALELGYDVTGSPWTGIAVAKGVPDDVVEKLRKVLAEVVADEKLIARAKQSKTELSYADGPSFEKQWEREYNNFKAVTLE